MTPQDLLDQLAIRIYSAPLSEVRTLATFPDLSKPLHLAILVIDFETEVSMNGILGFIGNSSGVYVQDTEQALHKLGRDQDAKMLAEIAATAKANGMTHETIQAERSALPVFAITSFQEVHGDKWNELSRKIQDLADRIDFPGVMDALLNFVQDHQDTLAHVLAPSSEA